MPVAFCGVLMCADFCQHDCSTAEDVDDVRREVQIMHHLAGHPHITLLKGAYEDRSNVHLVSQCASNLAALPANSGSDE